MTSSPTPKATALLPALAIAAALLVSPAGGCGDDPPEVLVVQPVAGATNVPLDTVITVTFSEAMDPATIDASSVTIAPAVAATVSYDASSHTATLTPTAPLALETTYTVTASTACADAEGQTLEQPFSSSFTTRWPDLVWSEVGGQLSPTGAESEDPTALFLDGQPAVGYRHASFAVKLQLWDGASWGDSAADPAGGALSYTGCHAPSFCSTGDSVLVAFSLAGDPEAADDTFYDRVFVHAFTTADGWTALNGGGEVSVLSSSAGAHAREPDIACRAEVDPAVVWSEDQVGDGEDVDHLWLARLAGGSSSRSGPFSRQDSGSYATDVRSSAVLIGDEGVLYIAHWESHPADQERTELYVSRYAEGTSTPLGGAVADDYDRDNLSKPSLARLDGVLYVAYTQANSTDHTRHVYVQRYKDDSWHVVGDGPVSAFTDEDHYDSGHPDLRAARGRLFVAWDEQDQYDGPFVYVAVHDEESDAWQIFGEKLNFDPTRAARDPSLSFDAEARYLYVAFEEQVDGSPQIFVKRKPVRP